MLTQVIEVASTVDQLSIPSLLSFEYLVRRLQLFEEAHMIAPSAPVYEGSEHWLGTGRRKGGMLISPALSKHVASRVKAETEIATERRKAREERRLVPTPKKPKGGAKGDHAGGGADAS